MWRSLDLVANLEIAVHLADLPPSSVFSIFSVNVDLHNIQIHAFQIAAANSLRDLLLLD
ncbi:MAG: hypothetical protein L7W43_02945 [Rubripirellula sp.]|nr:hypothetical protein [Rubripirellula sp.]